MIVEPAPDVHDEMITLLKEEHRLAEQREGMHVSDLVYCLTKSYWKHTDPLPPSDDEVVMWSIGWGLERVLIPRLHVAPITVDGITGTPDFALHGVPADLKSTRMAVESSAGCAVCGEPYVGHSKTKHGHVYEKAPPVQFVMPEGWVRQFMAYTHMLDTHRFIVVVVHLIPAVMKEYTLHFTEGELEDNWQWMLDRKSMLEWMLENKDPRPFESNMEYECANCSRLLDCQLYMSIKGMRPSGAS